MGRKTSWLLGAAVLLTAVPAVAQQPEPTQSQSPDAASTPDAAEPQAPVYDPVERTNRGLYALHRRIDRSVSRPVARGYVAVTPRPVRRGVRNVLNNLGEPVTFINDVLQGQFVRAGETATRFVTNSTVGVLGLFDVAAKAGVPIHYEDFGQTLGAYGVPPGPYVFIPVLGPSNLRDIGGHLADVSINPVNHATFEGDTLARSGAFALNAVDGRAAVDDGLRLLEESATDEYATFRSLHSQNRRAQIANGVTDVQALPEFEAPPAPAPTATPQGRRR